MKYYSIDLPAESKETGNVYPQVAFDKTKEAFKFRHNSYPNENPILSATLEKGANLTDIVSQGSITGHGLLINEKVKNLLFDFNIINHKYYKCPLKDHLGNVHQYFWLALAQPQLINLIDFKNSNFYTTEAGFREDEIDLNSYDDYLNKKEGLPNHTWSIKAEKISVLPHRYDLFVLPSLYIKILLSDRLKQTFIEYKVTGVLIKEAPIQLNKELL